ncbi:PLP-dependent aminotransferase family protein [Paenibacillus thiaminolyticus]|uniref:aminotransferase-like domain-containing protein n=1 Tax=Paenibacillus thiaminolyticus TaxID=49283 RepID=UPI002175F78F|nr:PLP-dependent aminotransferase family protein [Paenibacillus thiaminolyticus]
MWMPDRRNSQPLYQQIADDIERRIAYGEFPPGSLLPSERKLAAHLGVNRSTVILAYAELRALGIIESRSGSGTRVSKYKWGATPKHTPNWHRYVEGGSFLPNVAFLSQYRGIQTTESSILITSGSQQSLCLITQCLLAPGDAVAIEDPSYCYSLPMFQSAGLRLFRLPVDQHGIRPENVRALYKKHRIKMVFLNPNYQNPTGAVLDAERRAELLHVTSELGLPIVEDDPFSLTAYDGKPPLPLKSIDSLGSVLYIGSFSKIAASGLRVGWMVAPHSVVDRLADARQQMDFGLSLVPQKVAAQEQGRDPKPPEQGAELAPVHGQYGEAARIAARQQNDRAGDNAAELEQILRARPAVPVRLKNNIGSEQRAENDDIGHQVDPESECAHLFHIRMIMMIRMRHGMGGMYGIVDVSHSCITPLAQLLCV